MTAFTSSNWRWRTGFIRGTITGEKHPVYQRGLARPLVAGIGISHPDRLIYPDLGISKLEFARYFEHVSEWIVPHVAGRPLTLLHCPGGANETCRFLKHAKAW